MGEWTRSTKELSLENTPPEMMAAIQAHIETYNLGPILVDTLMCIETTSENKKGFFGGGEKQIVEVDVLTHHWLVIAIRSGNDAPSVLSLPLENAVIIDYADSPGYKILPDSGLDVTGQFTGRMGEEGSLRISKFIGLGDEPAALKFKDAVRTSLLAVKR
jgi:hypothetical protein